MDLISTLFHSPLLYVTIITKIASLYIICPQIQFNNYCFLQRYLKSDKKENNLYILTYLFIFNFIVLEVTLFFFFFFFFGQINACLQLWKVQGNHLIKSCQLQNVTTSLSFISGTHYVQVGTIDTLPQIQVSVHYYSILFMHFLIHVLLIAFNKWPYENTVCNEQALSRVK